MKKIWMIIWVLPLVLLISWLYQQTQLNFHRYHDVQEEIESFYRYSSQFDQSISKQFVADYPSYLKTNQVFAKLKTVSLDIHSSLDEKFPRLEERFHPYLDELDKEILTKEVTLLNFYEKNSVFRNTQSYLLSVAMTSKTLDSELKIYLLDSLINSSESYTQAEKRRQMLIQSLINLKSNDDEAKLILRHLTIYIQQVSALDTLLNDLTSSRLNIAVDSVNELLKAQYLKDLIVVRRFEAGLFAASIILLLGLGLVVYLLNKSHQKQQALLKEKFKMQEMMIQSEKMLSVGGLAAGMAHEINNPLAGIIQNLQVIQNRLSINLPKNLKVAEACHIKMEDIVKYLEQRDIYNMISLVLEAGQRAAKIVNNTLSFSRKGVGIKTNEDINNIVEQTINLSANDYDLKKKYDFRKIEITRNFSKELPYVSCEASEIQQVLFNIFKNGAQAMMSGVHKTPEFKVSTQLEANNIIISIKDNGPGMPESVRKRIFEPFFTTKSPGVGTGLGLSVSYFIITKNHHGEMIANSVDGEGTEFIIKLPLALS